MKTFLASAGAGAVLVLIGLAAREARMARALDSISDEDES